MTDFDDFKAFSSIGYCNLCGEKLPPTTASAHVCRPGVIAPPPQAANESAQQNMFRRLTDLERQVRELQGTATRRLVGCKNFAMRDGRGFCRNCGYHSSEHEGLEHTGPAPTPPCVTEASVAQYEAEIRRLEIDVGRWKAAAMDNRASPLEPTERDELQGHVTALQKRLKEQIEETFTRDEKLAQREALLREVLEAADMSGGTAMGSILTGLAKRIRSALEQAP